MFRIVCLYSDGCLLRSCASSERALLSFVSFEALMRKLEPTALAFLLR